MFRRFDMVAVPDGRKGLVAKVLNSRGVVTVQFGAGGPFEEFRAQDLRFTQDEFLDACAGTDFYQVGRKRAKARA